MSTKRKATQPRPWQPMQRAAWHKPNPLVAERAESDPDVARVLDELLSDQVWRNDRYTATVARHSETGEIMMISVRRNDRKPIHDWRHFQRIKNDIAGPEREAFELYPAESRLMDTANQYYLWVMPPGVQIPAGYDGRNVNTPAEAAELGAVQRELDADTPEASR